MSFDEGTAQRIREVMLLNNIDFTEKKMFSGICFFVDDKMCCGTHFDKKHNQDLLLCRIGEEQYSREIENDDCIPMEFTGKPMKGYIFVLESGIKTNKQLAYWMQLCLNFNPLAAKSKKKKIRLRK